MGGDDPLVTTTIVSSLTPLAELFRPKPGLFLTPTCFIAPDLRELLTTTVSPFFNKDLKEKNLFPDLRKQFKKNLALIHQKEAHTQQELSFPTDTQFDLILLRNTPFWDVITLKNYLPIPQKQLTEHGAIFAPAGAGKTQLLQYIFDGLISMYPPMSLWVFDSHGDMLKTISHLKVFNPDDGELKDRLIIIDPEEEHPPQLNLLQMGGDEAATDRLFLYMFTAIDNTLTPQQSTTVTYLMRLVKKVPNATIETVLDILEDRSKTLAQSPYKKYYDLLDERAKSFFANHFFQPGPMTITRNSIARRLYALLANTTFTKMFAATENTFNPDKAIKENKIVLINTSKKLLGDGSAVLGRFFIAQALSAAYRRPEGERNPALLIIDEAAEYFDYQTESILSEARKFGLGMLSASQYLGQLDAEVRQAIFGNCSMLFAGPVGAQDASALAREMNTTPETIRDLEKNDTHTQFAFSLHRKKSLTVTIPLGHLESEEKMTDEQYQRLRYRPTPEPVVKEQPKDIPTSSNKKW
jgi:hypothetical protein